MVAGVRGELLQRQRVLWEARAAPADSRAKEVWAEPVVEADPLRDARHVGADELANVRDLVDEADSRDEEGVGGELDHLGGVHVCAHDRRVDLRMQRLDCVAVRLVERPDHYAVRLHEVAHRGALRRELRIRDVADRLETARVERSAHLLTRPDGDGRLHDDRRARVVGELVHDRPHRREVGIAGVRRRRADRHVQEVGPLHGFPHVEREPDSLAVAREDVVEPRLVDRHLPVAQALDPLRQNVADDDLVTEIGEARAGDEADVTGPEDRDPSHAPSLTSLRQRPMGSRLSAIAIIVEFESWLRMVFMTQ